MSNDKPSPGRWYADGPAVYTQYHEPVAVCGPDGPYEANARFIAAAPEMLALLRELRDQSGVGVFGDRIDELIERYGG